MSDKPSKHKPRKRVNTAEKRASHNLVERQRREQLNGRFIDLAKLLPSLASQKRPSKSAIVNGSIAHLTVQRDARLIAARELRALFAENQDTLKELNEYRAQAGKDAKTSMGWTAGMEEVVKVEDETFGNFTSFDEDGMDGQDPADQDEAEVEAESESNVGLAFDSNAAQVHMAFAGNGSLPPSMLGAYPQAGMFMHPGVKHEQEFSRFPVFLNRHPSFSSSSPSSQEGLSARQQASMMMQQTGYSGVEHHGGADISPSVGRPSFSQPDMRNVAQDFMSSPQLGQGFLGNDMNEMPYGDKVSTWTQQQQQLLLHVAQQRRNTVAAGPQPSWIELAGLSEFNAHANLRSQSSSQYHGNALPSQLTAAHVTLLARQPHLAAAVFPPACSAELAASAGLQEYSPEPHLAMLSQHTPNRSGNAFDQWQKMNRSMNYNGMPTPAVPISAPSGTANMQTTPTSTTSGSSPSSMNGPTVSELREAVRHGMSVGMGMSLGMPTWSTEMEGFA